MMLPQEYVPTPEQIREETRKIQASWSHRERRQRSGQPTHRLTIKVVSTKGLKPDETGDDQHGWHYLSNGEVNRQRKGRRKPVKTIEESVPPQEVVERELYQASTVSFGEGE